MEGDVAASAPAPGVGLVLIVDDAAIARSLLRAILTKEGFNVVEAENGQDAIRKFHALRPQLVTMDIMMDSMNGMIAIQALMTIDPQARIIVCSSTSDQNVVTQTARLGVRGFVTKPFTHTSIASAVRRALA